MSADPRALPTHAPAIVAGGRHDGDAVYETIDPTTEAPIATITECGLDDVRRAAAAAAEVAPQWAATSIATRREVLRIAGAALQAQRERLIELAIADCGARVSVATSSQVDAAIARLLTWSRMADDVLRLPDPAPSDGLCSDVVRRPVGVVGAISPYNFPLLAMIGKVAPALFAGNAVLMKPAPQDPLLVVALGDALLQGLEQVGAPSAVVSLLTGSRPELGAAVVDDPNVAAISFTGSTAVGHAINEAAAPTMKRLLLELGGKGACIVRADADVPAVANALLRTWTVQAGQVCLTPARIIADSAVHDQLADLLLARLGEVRLGDPHDPETTVGPVISAAQRDKIEQLVASAAGEGAEVHRGGTLPETGYFVRPTLITGCQPRHTVMQEEAFGPVLAMMPSEDDEQAVAAANSTRYALTDYLFTADEVAADAIAARLQSAQVGVNHTRRHGTAPFGGNQGSGFGRSGGVYSLESCTTVQTVSYLDSSED